MQAFTPPRQAPEPYRVTSELLVGATLGGYLILGVALYCFGQGLMTPTGTANDIPPFLPYSQDPHMLALLIPGIIVGTLSYLQIISKRRSSYSNQKTVRCALWLNAIGSLGFCLLVALKRGPDTGWVPADEYIRLVASIATVLSFSLGILISIFNIFRGLLPVQKLQSKS